MRITVPNLLYALAHPLRAARYVVHRDRISYNVITKFLSADPVIVEAGTYDGTTTVEMASFWPKSTTHAFEPVSSAVVEVRRKVAVFGKCASAINLLLGPLTRSWTCMSAGMGLQEPVSRHPFLPRRMHRCVNSQLYRSVQRKEFA